ncbi:MAG: hypothetical protein CMJ28_00415 [Phycisphaerae bacterium]|nr:hypothetical protein [Phycisphaerae bacterium]
MSRFVTVLRFVLVSLLGTADVAWAQDQIVDVGLAGAVRKDGWVPVKVQLSANGTPRDVRVIGLGVTPDGDVLHSIKAIGVPPTTNVEVTVLTLPRREAVEVAVLVEDNGISVRHVAPLPARIPVSETVVVCVGPIPNGLAQLRDPDPRVRGFSSRVEPKSLADVNKIPSDWRALDAVDVLVLPAEGLPAALGSVRWSAVQRWVREGGHLVVYGTETGWQSIEPMLCGLSPVRRTLDLSQLRQVLSPSNALPLLADRKRGVEVLDRGAAAFPWVGKMYVSEVPLVVGRGFGRGRVDWLGVPIQLPRVTESNNQMKIWPDATFFSDLFMLAGDPISRVAFDASDPSDRLSLRDDSALFEDRDIESMLIEESENSTITNVAIFVPLYALLLGPGLALWGRAKGRSNMVWPFAAACSLLGVMLMLLLVGRPGSGGIQLRHFTVLDQTYDEAHQVLGFGQVQSGGFGRVEVARPNGAIRPWAPNGETLRFPDRRIVESGPDEWSLPTRGVPVPLRWTGSLLPNETWGVVRFKSDPVASIDLVTKAQGVLVHSFPAPLQQVRLIAVVNESTPRRRLAIAGEDISGFIDPGRLPMVAFEANIAAEGGWAPGVPLDLSQEDFARSWTQLDETLEDRGWRPRETFRGDFGQNPQVKMSLRNRLLDAAVWPLAHPTPWLNPGDIPMSTVPKTLGVTRRLGGGLRLGSPGLLVVGFIEDVPAPGGPLVDEDESTSSGTVFVRAFLPLPVKEQ